MISKIESGSSGARFPSIERLAAAVEVDPAEVFTSDIPTGAIKRGAFGEICAQLSDLSESDLEWVRDLIDTALHRGGRTRGRSRSPISANRERKRALRKRKSR